LRRLLLPLVWFPALLALAGCKQGYSPNIYAANAAQAEAAVQRGIIIGVRQVTISTDGTIGAATGGAVGGVAGSQLSGGPVVTALGAIGGTLVGGIGGAAAAQAVSATKGWEYIVQEAGDKLVSVTQTSKTPLPLGMDVLVIAGAQQARIVPDYTMRTVAAGPAAQPAASTPAKTAAAPGVSGPLEIDISPALPSGAAAEPLQVPPVTVASDPAAAPAAHPPSANSGAVPAAPSATPSQATVPIAATGSAAAPAGSAAAATP
jgi:outer membrane lipoprotein SlyB